MMPYQIALFLCLCGTSVSAFNSDRVHLGDVSTLTLRRGQWTNGRRSAPVPQLKCVGGTAGCDTFIPEVVQCYNRGSDGRDYQWECKSDMDDDYRFGRVEVTCEGYDYPDDPYILAGSCGLEYTIDYTKSGQQRKYQQHNHQAYGSAYDSGHHNHQQRSSWSKSKHFKHMGLKFSDLIILAIVAVIIYAVYKTCISPTPHTGPGATPSAPPPPGFRPEYMPDQGGNPNQGYPSQPPPPYESCGSSSYGNGGYSSTYAPPPAGGFMGNIGNMFGGRHRRNGGGGFWTGAATGGLMGYIFGSRTNTNYQQPYYNRGYRHGGSTWGSNAFPAFGSASHTTSSSFSRPPSAPSPGTSRTASGFGGTKRR